MGSAGALGLANTNTTNALSGKISATTASKVNMPNLPPGVASMLHPQYLAAAGLAPAAAFYGLQQPMYGAYGNTGLGDLAAMPTTGYYDPNNHFAPTTLGAAMANRDLGNTNLANLNSLMAGSTSSSTTGNSGNPASQFQKSYGTSYGSGYDALSQQAAHAGGNKDFSSNYPSNGQSKSTGGSAVGGTGKGAHQYWGNTLTGTQLW